VGGPLHAKRLDVRRSAPKSAKENADVGLRFVRDHIRRRNGRDEIERLRRRERTIVGVGAKQYAVHRDDDGVLHTLSAPLARGDRPAPLHRPEPRSPVRANPQRRVIRFATVAAMPS